MKIKHMDIIIVLCIAIITIAFAACKTMCVPTYKGEITDHFDGKKFYNKGGNSMGSFKELMQYQIRNKKTKWPDFTDSLPTKITIDTRVDSDIKFMHINHATVLIQHKNVNIITDPVFSKRASPYEFMGPKRKRNPALALDDLPKIDVILISHDHYDHLDVKNLKKLSDRDNPKILVGLGLKAFLEKFDIVNVQQVDWNQSIPIGPLTFTFKPANHWSNRMMSPYKTLWGSYIIESDERKIYFAGDTAYGSHFKEIQQELGSIDLALIPVGAYIPRSFMKFVHMPPEEAFIAHKDLNPKFSLAIHWGTFQLTGEGMFDPVDELQSIMDEDSTNNFLYDREHNQYFSLKELLSK